MKMHYYNCKLRLHGNVVNEVMKENISAPEIVIMRKLHGDDAVVEIKYAYTGKIDAGAERRRLSERYNGGLKAIDKTMNVLRLFGEDYQPLLNAVKGIKLPDPGKLIKKSEMKAARTAAAVERASAQDDNMNKIDEDDIDDEDDFDDDFEDDDLEEIDTAPAKKPVAANPNKRPAVMAKAAGGVI